MALVQPIGLSEPDAAARHAAIRRRPRDPDDGAVHRDQGCQSGLPLVLPDGRFLRDVLRGRRNRLARARHHAHQTRQASGRRHPDVRRAGRARRRISASPDRARPPRRGVRTARGPGRGQEARHQERGAARRGAPGHARHAHRRHAARRQAQQLSARRRARAASSAGEDARFALAWIDISTGEFRITECDRLTLPAEIARLEPSEIIVSDALFADAELGALLARAAGGDAAHPRRVRRRAPPSGG